MGLVSGLISEPIGSCRFLKWTVVGMSKFYKTGINCVIPTTSNPCTFNGPKIKKRSRMYQMAILKLKLKGENNWPLLLDTDGYIAEGVTTFYN